MTTWIVDVEQEGAQWLATVRDLPGAHTFAETFEGLDSAVREVIALMLDDEADPTSLDVAYAFSVPA
jgi:predicted RNase H-like HicB family nuclease